MIRVLQVLPRSAGGIGRHVARIVASLDGRDGLSVDAAGPPGAVEMPKPLIPVPIPQGPWGHGAAVRRLRDVVAAYDVVHAHGLRAGIDAGRAARAARVPVALTVHNLVRADISGRVRAAVFRRAEPMAVRASEVVFAVSEEIAAHLAAAAPGARIEVLHAPADEPVVRRTPERVRADLGLGDGDHLVVTASRLAPQKALDVMLDAIAQLPASVHLAIAGEGPLERRLRAHARGCGIDGRVSFLGFRDDVPDLVAAADAFCLSSVWEAVALAAQEAVMLGTPVVATDVGGMRELIVDGESGRLVPAGDARALAVALEEVIATDRGRRFAARARSDYDERFSAQGMLARLAAVYEELAGVG